METTDNSIQMKTGAIVCVKDIEGTDDKQYLALMFITDIPNFVTDHDLEGLLGRHLKVLSENCHAIIVRADINSTSNEVAEQYNFHEDNAQRISYESFI